MEDLESSGFSVALLSQDPQLADPLLLPPAPPLLLQSQGKEKGEAATLQAPVQVYFRSFT